MTGKQLFHFGRGVTLSAFGAYVASAIYVSWQPSGTADSKLMAISILAMGFGSLGMASGWWFDHRARGQDQAVAVRLDKADRMMNGAAAALLLGLGAFLAFGLWGILDPSARPTALLGMTGALVVFLLGVAALGAAYLWGQWRRRYWPDDAPSLSRAIAAHLDRVLGGQQQ